MSKILADKIRRINYNNRRDVKEREKERRKKNAYALKCKAAGVVPEVAK